MKSWITALGIAALTAIVCALVVSMSEGPDEPVPQAAPAAGAALGPPPSRPAAAGSSEESPPPPAASESEDDGAAPASAAPAALAPAAVRDRIGTSFEAERSDPMWNALELARLEKAIPALLPQGSQIHRVECRSTMCRIESRHASLDQFGEFVQRAFGGASRVNQSGFFAGLLAEPEPGQPVVTVAYIARKGHSLPMPERLAATP